MVEAKGFHAHDGTGFSLARLGGIKTGLITKRVSETVRLRARDLKIEHVYQGAADKLTAFREILAKEKLKPEEAAFVGDDIIDLPVMRACGLAFAVADAREDVKDEAHVITDHRGGEGAVRDAVEYILKAQGSLGRCVDAYLSDHTPVERQAPVTPARQPVRSLRAKKDPPAAQPVGQRTPERFAKRSRFRSLWSCYTPIPVKRSHLGNSRQSRYSGAISSRNPCPMQP